MFVELATIGAIRYGYNRFKNLDIYSMKKEIKKILADNELDCYTIIDIQRNLQWGYKIEVSLNGKGFKKLETIKTNIETKLGYQVFIEQNENLKTATIKIIVLPLSENTKFRPYKTKPYEIYLGISYTIQELIVNLQKFPHCLVSGQTGCGKTELIRIILTNLINNFSDRDVNIYFSDLSDMCDFEIFQKCRHTKGYAKNIEEAEKLFNYLMHIYTKRLEIFETNGCKNISEYNEKLYGKRMPYIYLVMDEMADYFPTNKLESEYDQKVRCYNLLKHMVRKFRKTGIFLIIGIQRPDTTVLDASLKSGLCCKIGFSQNNDASSLVVCDTTELTNLENRKAMLMYGNKREWLKTLYIDDKTILEYIKQSLVNGNREVLDDYNKFLPKKEAEKVTIGTSISNNKKKEVILNIIHSEDKPINKGKRKARAKKDVKQEG